MKEILKKLDKLTDAIFAYRPKREKSDKQVFPKGAPKQASNCSEKGKLLK